MAVEGENRDLLRSKIAHAGCPARLGNVVLYLAGPPPQARLPKKLHNLSRLNSRGPVGG